MTVFLSGRFATGIAMSAKCACLADASFGFPRHASPASAARSEVAWGRSGLAQGLARGGSRGRGRRNYLAADVFGKVKGLENSPAMPRARQNFFLDFLCITPTVAFPFDGRPRVRIARGIYRLLENGDTGNCEGRSPRTTTSAEEVSTLVVPSYA